MAPCGHAVNSHRLAELGNPHPDPRRCAPNGRTSAVNRPLIQDSCASTVAAAHLLSRHGPPRTSLGAFAGMVRWRASCGTAGRARRGSRSRGPVGCCGSLYSGSMGLGASRTNRYSSRRCCTMRFTGRVKPLSERSPEFQPATANTLARSICAPVAGARTADPRSPLIASRYDINLRTGGVGV